MVNDDKDLLNGLIDRTRQSQEYIWRCQLKISKFATRYVTYRMSPKFPLPYADHVDDADMVF